MAAHNGELTYYPAFCHKQSPTYFTWVKMSAVDVHRLKRRRGFEAQNLYFYNNHPIQFICLAGVIIARDEHPHRTILVLDDNTGSSIEVVCSKPVPPKTAIATTPTAPQPMLASSPTHLASATSMPLDISTLCPGALAKLKGTLARFRGILQLHLERFTLLADTNDEVRFWDERARFLVDVLCVPWVLGPDEVEKLRREGVERDRRAKLRAEIEERHRLRVERRYAKEEALRDKLAAECRAASRTVAKAVVGRSKGW